MKKNRGLLSIFLVVVILFNMGTVGLAYTPDLTVPGGVARGSMLNIGYGFDNNDSTAATAYSHENSRTEKVTYYSSLGYDFGAGNAKRVRAIGLKQSVNWPYPTPATIGVSYSDDGATWTGACTMTLINEYSHTYEIPDVGAHRYWTLGGNNSLADLGWTIYELELMEVSAPQLTITSPTVNQGYSNLPGSMVMRIAGTVSCQGTSSTICFNVNGDSKKTIPGAVAGTGSFAFDYNITEYASNSYTVNIWAENSYGAQSAVISVPISITQNLPVISVTSPTPNLVFSSKPGFNRINLTGTATSQGWNSTVYYRIDGGGEIPLPGTISNSGSYAKSDIDVSALPEGPYTLYVKSENNQSPKQVSATKSVPFRVDLTGPIITKLGVTTAADSITVLSEATDNMAGVAGCLYTVTAPDGTVAASTGLIPTSSITLEKLKPNTTYAVRQEVRDAVGNVSVKTANVTTRARTPKVDVKTNGTTADITLADDNQAANTKYKIMSGSKFVDQNGQLTASPTWITLPALKKITVTGLNSNLGYGFRASAMGTDGIETELSDTRIINPIAPPPVAPTLLKALAKINETTKANEITVYWDPIAEATGYMIEVDGVETPTGNDKKPEYTHIISGTKQTTHKYRIKTLRGDSSSPWSEYITAMTIAAPPIAPANLNPVPYATSVVLNWDAITGATGYELLMDGVVKDVGYKLTYTNKHLSPDTLHTYAVRAKNKAGVSPWTELKVVRTTSNLPAIPVINYTKSSNSQITVAWEDVADAEGYDVEFDGVVSNCGMYNYCLRTNLEPLKPYTFRARAKNAIGESAWSAPVTVSTYFLNTSECLTALEEDVKINLTWKPVTGAERYIISLNGTETDVGSVLQYTLTNLTTETEYKVKVKAVSAGGVGNWTDELRVNTLPQKPDKPKNVTSLVLPNYVSLYWNTVTEASGYDVELDGVIIDNDKDTLYIDEALEPNTNHIFRIRAKNTAIEGDWSDPIKVTTMPEAPKAPSGIRVLTTKNLANISWTKIIGAQGYEIEVDGGTIIALGDNNTYIHRRLVEGSEHRYRIRSLFINEISPWSGEIINNSILALCKKNTTVDLGLTAQDVSDFSKYTLTVTYDPKAMDIADLCTLSSSIELKEGKVKGTDIQIKEFTPGKIVFLTNKVVNPGESWTGVINSIKFKAKVSGRTSITYTVYSAPEDEE